MRDASGDSNRLLATAITAATLAVLAAVGQSLFFGPYLWLTLAPLCGLASAVAVRDRTWAAACAAVAVALGSVLASLVASPAWGAVAEWAPTAATAAAVAAVIGFAAGWSLAATREPRLARLFSAVCVVLVIAAMSLAVLDHVTRPLSGGSTLLAQLAPANGNVRIGSDETMFALSIRGFREGTPYYVTLRDLLVRRNAELVGSVETHSPMSYRLPSLYWFLAAVGGSGTAIVSAMLLLAAAAVSAAYLLCRRFVAQHFALLGAVATATGLAGYAGGVRLLDAEFWAGMLGVVFLAAFVWADASRHRRAWLGVSLLAALLAAAVRELGIAFVLVGLAASLAPGTTGESLPRRAGPWIAGLAAVIVGYALHWRAVLGVIATLPPVAQAARMSWVRPFGVPLASSVWFSAVFMQLALWVTIALFVLGTLGSLLGPRTARDRIAVGLVVCGGCAVSLFLGAAGDVGVGRLVPPTWQMLVEPSLLACVPLAAAIWERSADATAAHDAE